MPLEARAVNVNLRTGLGIEEQSDRNALLARRQRVGLPVGTGERNRRCGLADERMAGHGLQRRSERAVEGGVVRGRVGVVTSGRERGAVSRSGQRNLRPSCNLYRCTTRASGHAAVHHGQSRAGW